MVLAAIGFVALTCSAAVILSIVLPVQPVRINVRWLPEVTEAQREELEQRFHLVEGRPTEGTTWRYRLDDPSRANIRALVQHDRVDDTAHLNRVRFRPAFATDRPRQVWVHALAPGAAGAALLFVWLAFFRPNGSLSPVRAAVARLGAPASVALSIVGLPAVAATSGLLVLLLCHSLWRTPYGISETVALLEDVDRNSPWHFFDMQGTYFRPLFYVTLSAIWHGAGSIGAALFTFSLVHIATVLALIVLFIRQLRPVSQIDAAAAIVAVAVLVGSAPFRENLENLPLNQMMVVMVLTLAVWSLLERPWRPWHGPAIVGLTLVAIGYKEQGVVIAPLVVAAWWMGAPGTGGRTAAVTTGVTAVYLVLRLSGASSWQLFPQDVGYGFTMLSAAEAANRFGAFPAPIYLYNVGSTIASILFSEPTAGVFRVVQHFRDGRLEPWEINHVVSSAALTGLVVWWARRVCRREANGRWSYEARLCVATALAVAGSAALSFVYTRDRMGGIAVVFYALASFHALRAAAEGAGQLSAVKLTATSLALMLLAGAWHIRAIGTIEYAREAASKNRREWIIRLQQRRLDFADRPVYLRTMEAMVAQGTDPAAARRTDYPRWVVRLLGDR